MSIESTLAERGNRYGDFTDHARLCQDLKDVMTTFAVVQNTPNSVAVHFPWGELPATHKQALEVIADKIARILSGDPNYADNWHDIQGYAKLVEDRLPQPAEGLFDEAASVAAKAAADVDLQQMRSAGAPIDPADVDISDNSHPQWKDAPTWAKWLAQDSGGSWYWYECPIYAHEYNETWCEQVGFDGHVIKTGEAAECNPDWRNTRQARPTK